ncbi:MAG: hypothetical protein Q9167_006210 [Letrouitia subvulpina]
MVQSCLINTLALAVIWRDEERWNWGWEERVWGYSGAQGGVQGLALGYFLWDFVESARSVEIQGWGAVGHAVAASVVSGLGFRPFVNYYGLNFVLYELSTPFLNIHWWMDKLEMTGSAAQLVNGILLLITFGVCRLVWGTWQNWNMYNDVWRAIQNPGKLPVPTWLALSYLASSCVLSLLNFYWFGKMIQAVLKRFEKPEQKVGKDEKQH